MNVNVNKSAGILIGSLVLAGLVSCGGGGSSGPTTVVPKQLPSALVLFPSAGVLSRYAGTWTSDCGRTFRARVPSARNTYMFSSPIGTRVTGTLSQEQFSDDRCTERLSQFSSSTVVEGVSLTYGTTLSADFAAPKTEDNNFTGTVDQVTLISTPLGGIASSSIYYIGFSDAFSTFRLTTGLPFSVSDLVYKKSNP